MPSRHPYPIHLHFHAHIHNHSSTPTPTPTFTHRTTKITLRPKPQAHQSSASNSSPQSLPFCFHPATTTDTFFFFTLTALALLLAGGLCAFVWKQPRYRAVRRATKKVSSHSDLRDIIDGAAARNEVLLGQAQTERWVVGCAVDRKRASGLVSQDTGEFHCGTKSYMEFVSLACCRYIGLDEKSKRDKCQDLLDWQKGRKSPIIRTGHIYIKHTSTYPNPTSQRVTPQSIRLS